MVPNDPIKHHHSPIFYLEGWCDQDSKVAIYSRPYDRVVCRRLHPAAIGYEPELYTVVGAPEKQKRAIERDYLAPKVDNPAAPVLAKLRAGKLGELTDQDRNDWARFVAAGHFRSPQSLKRLAAEWESFTRERMIADGGEAAYQAAKKEEDPPTFFEWGQKAHPDFVSDNVRLRLPDVIENKKYANVIRSLRWAVLDLSRSRHELLTSELSIPAQCQIRGQALCARLSYRA